VSGVAIVPQGGSADRRTADRGLANPTSGIVPLCTVVATFLFQQIQGLRSFVHDGYVVASTGSKVRVILMPNIGHGRVAQASTMAAHGWISGRFAGKPARDCSRWPDDRQSQPRSASGYFGIDVILSGGASFIAAMYGLGSSQNHLDEGSSRSIDEAPDTP
jgi:hypothetical protein